MSLNLKYGRYGDDLYTLERGSNIFLRIEVGGTDTRMQMAHTNIRQRFRMRSGKLVALELQHRTKAKIFKHDILLGSTPRNIRNDTR